MFNLSPKPEFWETAPNPEPGTGRGLGRWCPQQSPQICSKGGLPGFKLSGFGFRGLASLALRTYEFGFESGFVIGEGGKSHVPLALLDSSTFFTHLTLDLLDAFLTFLTVLTCLPLLSREQRIKAATTMKTFMRHGAPRLPSSACSYKYRTRRVLASTR